MECLHLVQMTGQRGEQGCQRREQRLCEQVGEYSERTQDDQDVLHVLHGFHLLSGLEFVRNARVKKCNEPHAVGSQLGLAILSVLMGVHQNLGLRGAGEPWEQLFRAYDSQEYEKPARRRDRRDRLLRV